MIFDSIFEIVTSKNGKDKEKNWRNWRLWSWQVNKATNSEEPNNFTVVFLNNFPLQFKSKLIDEILEIFEQEIEKTNQNKKQEEVDSADGSVKDTIESLFKSNIEFLSSELEDGKLNLSLSGESKFFVNRLSKEKAKAWPEPH